MTFYFGKSSLRNRVGVDPRWIEISDYALSISIIDFGIPRDGGLRTAERQLELFNARKSPVDGVDSRSKHQDGLALDVFAYVDGHASWEPNHLSAVAAAILQSASVLGHRVEWGGLWRSDKKTSGIPYGWDMPHFQLVD